jgi:hypothetical protein
MDIRTEVAQSGRATSLYPRSHHHHPAPRWAAFGSVSAEACGNLADESVLSCPVLVSSGIRRTRPRRLQAGGRMGASC